MAEQSDATLEFDHNVIEHLGIRLYQNKFPNVISELISNSWDAGAENVWIDLHQDTTPQFISVGDDGAGMSYDDVRSRYLVIGKPKRKTPNERASKDRKPMGRKGIGKLAPFGIARTVDVITAFDGELNWFTLELDNILTAVPGDKKYHPPFHIFRAPLSDRLLAPSDHPLCQHAQPYIDRMNSKGSGTVIFMSQLTVNHLIIDEDIRHAIADKYNIVLARPDFQVFVNEKLIDLDECLPAFEFRIPASGGFNFEKVHGRDVRYWVGFVGSARWSSEQAGVGVYTHGKIAQDRPFYFYSKGKEIFQRYLYAVVEADWIDELDEDVISTDRTGVDWANSELSALKTWGAKKVLSWLDDYATFRTSRHGDEVAAFNAERRRLLAIPVFTKTENDEIDKLAAEASRDIDKSNVGAREELLSAISKAWINLPSRNLVKELWRSLVNTENDGAFTGIVSKLQEQSVPEAMGLALTFAQRAYALSVLNDLVHRKSETRLQNLVEDFPWILQPRGDLLTANRHLKTTIESAAISTGSEDTARAGRIIRGMTEQERADFVFLTEGNQKRILIVEIKAPSQELTQDNRRQLADYLDFTEQFHSEASITGMLVGRVPAGFKSNDNRIEPKSWNAILLECRASYVSLLASMLDRADPSPDDARLSYVHEFGGPAVWDLLNSLAQKDKPLRDLMDKHNRLLSDRSGLPA